jgi:plasmid maintenance system antidote protein VapI
MPRTKTVKAPTVLLASQVKSLGATEATLAAAINSTPANVKAVLGGKKTITPELSLIYGKALGLKDSDLADSQLALDLADAKKDIASKLLDVKKLRKVVGKPGRKPGKPAAAAATAAVRKPAARKPGRKPGRPAAVKPAPFAD